MILALLGGALLATAHHLFYASLNHNAAETGSYFIAGTPLSKQQFNLSMGTAIAFLVRVLFALAMSVAYVQLFWRSMKNNDPKLAELDWAAALLDNIFSLFNVKRGWSYPVLPLIAIIFW